jgi:SET domain-containing protein
MNTCESDYLYLQTSNIPNAGTGLFTAIKIYKDEVVSIYKGEIITNKEANVRAVAGNDQYFIDISPARILDSKPVEGFAKYANDAKGRESLGIKNNTKIAFKNKKQVCLIAIRNIKAGEEILCSYGKEYWKKHNI